MTTDDFPTETAPYFAGHRQMLWLGAGLLAALVVVLIFVRRDNARPSQLERIVWSTAVGDAAYLQLPEPLPGKPYPAIAHLQGQPLYPTNYERRKKREITMRRMGRDEVLGVNIYQVQPKAREAGGGEDEADRAYYLKVGPGEFVRLKPGEGGKAE